MMVSQLQDSAPTPAPSLRQRLTARSLLIELRRFVHEESGEIAPASYLLALMLTLTLMFFAFDLGLRKGSRLATEYAAFCAVRSAVVSIPRGEIDGGCLSESERTDIRHAAAGCLASVVSRKGIFLLSLPIPLPMTIDSLVKRAEHQISVRIFNQSGQESRCFRQNETITAEVTYRHSIPVPMSPLAWGGNDQIEMTATASAMIQTVR